MASNEAIEPTPIQNPSLSTKQPSPSEIKNSTAQKEPGLLISLFDQAASSPLIQKVDQNVPSEIRPALTRGVTHTRKVLSSLDDAVVVAKDTLSTDEALLSVEDWIGFEKNEGHLGERSLRVGRHVVSKVSTAMNEREKQVNGTCEAHVYSYLRYAIRFLISVFAVLLNSLAGFKGPGSSYISPAAKQVVDNLPDDIRKAVTEEGDLSEIIDEFRSSSNTDPTDAK